MKFLVDAQLPARLSQWLIDQGHDSIHTIQLPEQNRTDDRSIATVADNEDRVVVTKDADFATLKLLTGEPKRLLVVKTGNSSNADLLALFATNLPLIERLFHSFSIVELSKNLIAGGN